MKVLVKLSRWPRLIFGVFLLVLACILVVRHVTTTQEYNPFLASTVDIVPAHPPPGDTVHSTHNFRRPNRVITEYDEDVAARLSKLVDRQSTAADPELIRLIVDMLDPPSTHMVKMSRQLFTTPQSREVDQILREKRGGFYVECGAFDGERSSNTLHLERERAWSGLLVEMDPYFYTQLIGKSRRAWSINACLSPQPYVTQMEYKESSGGAGELMSSRPRPSARQSTDSKLVPCFPLHALLVALNETRVDYLSLDVEGFELEILRTIPWRQLDVSVLSVEYVHGRAGKRSYVEFMNSQGYTVHKDIHLHDFPQTLFVDDFIFVNKSLT